MCHCSFLPKHRPCLTSALPNADVHRVLRNQHSANRMLPYGSDVIGVLWLIFFAKLTQDRVIWEEGRSAEKMPQSDWHVGKPVGHFFDWWLMGGVAHCGWCHTLAGGPGLNKKASWASRGKRASKQHFCVVSASAPSSRFLYEFLPLWSWSLPQKKSGLGQTVTILSWAYLNSRFHEFVRSWGRNMSAMEGVMKSKRSRIRSRELKLWFHNRLVSFLWSILFVKQIMQTRFL